MTVQNRILVFHNQSSDGVNLKFPNNTRERNVDVVGGRSPKKSPTGLLRAILHKANANFALATLRPGAITPEIFHRFAEQRSLLLIPTGFYDPVGLETTLSSAGEEIKAFGVNYQLETQKWFLTQVFATYSPEFSALLHKRQKNGTFESLDALAYYSIIRKFRPKTILEVGAGFSTVLASIALAANHSGTLQAIDPYPRPMLAQEIPGLDLIVKKVQDVDVGIFTNLEPNDILFIDSSHTVTQGGDIVRLILEIIPQLKAGVLVHFHDIYAPFNYPRDLAETRLVFWNEMFLLLAYLSQNERAKILFGSQFAIHRLPESVKALFAPLEAIDGASLWFQVI
jgi:hypothetical protein